MKYTKKFCTFFILSLICTLFYHKKMYNVDKTNIVTEQKLNTKKVTEHGEFLESLKKEFDSIEEKKEVEHLSKIDLSKLRTYKNLIVEAQNQLDLILSFIKTEKDNKNTDIEKLSKLVDSYNERLISIIDEYQKINRSKTNNLKIESKIFDDIKGDGLKRSLNYAGDSKKKKKKELRTLELTEILSSQNFNVEQRFAPERDKK